MALRQYDPLQVVGSFVHAGGSVDILDGAVSGEFVSRQRDNPRWAREADRAGNTTRVKNNNRGGSVQITIEASSPTNQQLSNLVNFDDASENVVGVLVLKDLNGDTVVDGEDAFLEGHPSTISFGSERGSHVWTFQVGRFRETLGGRNLA